MRLQSEETLSEIEKQIPREIRAFKSPRQAIAYFQTKGEEDTASLLTTVLYSKQPIQLLEKIVNNGGSPIADKYLKLTKLFADVNKSNMNDFVEDAQIPFYTKHLRKLMEVKFSRKEMKVFDQIFVDLPRDVMTDYFNLGFKNPTITNEFSKTFYKSIGLTAITLIGAIFGLPLMIGGVKAKEKEIPMWLLILQLILFFGIASSLIQVITTHEEGYLALMGVFIGILMLGSFIKPEKKEKKK